MSTSSLVYSVWIIIYLVIVTIFVGILAISGLLVDTDIAITTPSDIGSLQTLPGDCLTPKYCTARGSVNLEDPDIYLFTYDIDHTNFTNPDYCSLCCKNEDTYTFFTGWIRGYSCQGQCLNLSGTDTFKDCSESSLGGASSQANNAIDVVDTFGTFVGFFTFQLDFGLGMFNFIIATIFVYVPLLILILCFLWWLRGNG